MPAKTQSSKTKKKPPKAVTTATAPIVAPITEPTPVATVAAAPTKDNTLAIVGLVLNILIIPGLGTLISGGPELKKSGIWQLVLAIVSVPLMFVIVGFPLYLGVWIWGIVTGVKMLQ